jgi:hypothetical protein
MALEHSVGRNAIVGKKARGGFAHRTTATGFGQSRTGTLGEHMGQFTQTLGPPQVAEVRIGKLHDGPTRGIGEIGHGCFLAQRVKPEVKVENPCPS